MDPVEVQLIAAKFVSDSKLQHMDLTYRSASNISDISASGGITGELAHVSLTVVIAALLCFSLVFVARFCCRVVGCPASSSYWRCSPSSEISWTLISAP